MINKLINKNNLTNKEELNDICNNIFLKKKNVDTFLINLDNYITFLKKYLTIDYNDLLYIIFNTINNDMYNSIIKKEKEFKKIFLLKYNENIEFISIFMKLKKRNFNNLITHLNNCKRRCYTYFEDIGLRNLKFYLALFQELETK